MTYETILVETSRHITTISLNRPENRNAMEPLMLEEIRDALRTAVDDTSRVVIVAAKGDHFSVGHDLSTHGESDGNGSGIEGLSPALMQRAMQSVNDFWTALAEHPKPTIAAVSGYAVGGGCTLAICCDLVVANSGAKFSQIFARRGLTVECGWALVQRVGLAKAKQLVFTADVLSASQAIDIGLIDYVTDGPALDDALTLAEKIAANAPISLRLAKEALNHAAALGFRQTLALEASAQAMCFASSDVREGFMAFLEKRQPEFRDR